MRTIIGVIVGVALTMITFLLVYPFVFNGVRGLFENPDLGTVIGLTVCLFITVPMIWLGVFIVGILSIVGAAMDDRARFNRSLKKRNR